MAKKNSLWQVFSKGLLSDNPLLALLLGTCPALAVTTSATNGVGMGLAATFVLVMSNFVISCLRKLIPDKVRIPAYITIIASFVTILRFLLEAYLPSLNQALGIFIPLITVNCIILGRAEAFAGKNPIIPSILDGLGMGLGFTLALLSIGGLREILGAGQFFGYQIPFIGGEHMLQPMLIFIMPPGGFFIFGIMIAIANLLQKRFYAKHPDLAVEGCTTCGTCGCGSGCPLGQEAPAVVAKKAVAESLVPQATTAPVAPAAPAAEATAAPAAQEAAAPAERNDGGEQA